MKKSLVTIGKLLLDQFIGVLSASMLVLCVSQFFKNSMTGYILAFCVCFGFYVYATYLTAFKSGFHDPHRAVKDQNYRSFLYKGALLGAISAIPLLVAHLLFLFVTAKASLAIYFINMYWCWPLSRIFPNHVQELIFYAYIPIIVVPWISYIAGYKNFMVSDLVVKLFKKISIENSKEKK